ncbi:MAG: thrombospondin type 3 repeat-containing protein [Clostridia bacterium]|nr:thrombospondin type 3 repeat-containing protein [Clostridia bacterium]
MKYNETLNYIHSLGRFSHKAGLNRITQVCTTLGNPQNDFKCIHIAGTNGKGSTCAFVSSALMAAGYKVGTFVSPFITDFCERIQINGEYISRDDLCRLSQRVIDTGVSLTEFEFITVVGFLCFAENKIDIAVLETGLGGRFDATNVIPKPLLSVITKIGLDHTAVLGDTLSQIAEEKCGIIKGDNVVTSHNQPNEALSVIKNHAINVIIPETNDLKDIKCSAFGNSFVYDNTYYETSLGGEYSDFGAAMGARLGIFYLYVASDFIPLAYDSDRVPYKNKEANVSFGLMMTFRNGKAKKDSDGDGVWDRKDKCPETPAEAQGTVDETGCPKDTDGDGVPDYLDKCPNTDSSMGEVDETGCPKDTDGDGVADYLDKCPNTSADAQGAVDENGCPKDADGDGVADYSMSLSANGTEHPWS